MPGAEQAPTKPLVIGWDVGGAHLKACLIEDGVVRDIAQWRSPLWQGLHHLDIAIAQARARWGRLDAAQHVATMTGEMVDLFATREQGVHKLAAQLAEALGPSLKIYAGRSGWVTPSAAQGAWRAIASANWHATASWLASRTGPAGAVLVDIGSTTTDLIPLRDGGVATAAAGDAERLASGELVYYGVVRTPLFALARRVSFGGEEVNVMNEFFATTADVYRLTGELDPAHDLHPSADDGPKDAPATRQRLARMIGRDAGDASEEAWLQFARDWRAAQLAETGGQLARVLARAGLGREAALHAAGCGDFLVAELAQADGRPSLRFADTMPGAAEADPKLLKLAQLCAPAVAVALLASVGR